MKINSKIYQQIISIVLTLGILLVVGIIATSTNNKKMSEEEVRIGYFHGGRVHGLYRAYVEELSAQFKERNYFEREKINLTLYSKHLLQPNWSAVPKTHKEMNQIAYGTAKNPPFGKVTGIEIIESIDDGTLQGGTPGESSFIQKISEGSDVVAVAMLGHEPRDNPGKVIVLRNDVVINSLDDFKGKTYGSRRAGPGDYIFLAEFFKSIGLDPLKDVNIIDQIPDNEQLRGLRDNVTQGNLLHLHSGIDAEKANIGYIYQKMDWLNPELSHALLVFDREYIEAHEKEVEAIIRAYMKRLKYEGGLTREERINPLNCKAEESLYTKWWHSCFGIKVEESHESGNYAVYDYPPLVRKDLLVDVQTLLSEYEFIDREVQLDNYIDNRFVKKIYAELESE